MSSLPVRGVDVGPETRCGHYHTDRDIVSFRFDCCDAYFPCFRCHAAVEDHEAIPWPRNRFNEPSVRCGACDSAFTVPTYLACAYRCPNCDAPFNPGCEAHADRYFETATGEADTGKADTGDTDG
ncbi:CHY zinc finger protein [Natrialba sp. PRR66]|uniref:CHY zinc finger protein n=1 Tax=Natrialba sp. PRR66 TaxID=3098146 RepID=UPI002B1DAD4F|nr:CHY zinc finger protein [Natrialba sp. PRR66]